MSDAPKELPAIAAPVAGADAMKGFVRDQLEAARILRDEKIEEDRDSAASRRLDACHLAMRYFDTFTAGQTPSVQRVIEVAREFERFLLSP